MAKGTNRVCYTCGKEYRYCPKCDGLNNTPNWLSYVCSDECNEIFQICAQYNLGHLSKSKARKKLNNLQAQNKIYTSVNITNTIKAIFATNKQTTDTPSTDEVSLSE